MLKILESGDNMTLCIQIKSFIINAPEVLIVREKVMDFAHKQNGTIERILNGVLVKTEDYTICVFDRKVGINYYDTSEKDRDVYYSLKIDLKDGIVATDFKKYPEDLFKLFKEILSIIGVKADIL